MNLYFAPMEGLTGYVYRNAHRACFGGVDKYFTPFLSPNQNHKFTAKEEKDVLPEHNQGIPLVPQILTNRAEDFIWAAGEMKARGYREVNLNLGCPSGTVVSKYKGAGFLARQEALNRFLDQIFQEVDLEISVKTRIGIAAPEEFPELMEIFNRYPIRELTVHPRLRTDFYKNTPDWESFGYAVKESRAPLCYNGDVFTAEAFRSAAARFPSVGSVMLGRGLLANPALAERIRGVEEAPLTSSRLAAFHQALYEGYCRAIPEERNVLFKMKEMWTYLICMFPEADRYGKKIKKAKSAGEYEAAVAALLREREPDPRAGYRAAL
ncbi:tRNA dihydrouridine synthase [Enterocloster lavalensis]|uniref:tRNA dihydrouridine synthase n=1 Tax=Enterocloster lavalensis TaxID=460384 RepID=UPI0023F19339|nr:tRNA-dihydrouridine synthase family protein [Enterocloster lavalensis]